MTVRSRILEAVPGRDRLGRRLARRLFDRPLFVVGDGRSGTSVLVDALGRHPEVIARPREAPLFDHLGEIYHASSGGPVDRYYRQCSELSLPQLAERLRLLAFETMWGEEAGFRLLLRRRREIGAKAWAAKRCWAAKAFPGEVGGAGLAALYPEARFLYIHRHGADVVHSKTKYPGFRDEPFEKHCRDWAARVGKYRWLRTFPRAMEVRHADLVTDPEGVFRRVQEFTGLEPSDEPARYCRTTLVHPLDQTTNSAADVAASLAAREPGYSKWSEEQRRVFSETCAEALAELGYDLPF